MTWLFPAVLSTLIGCLLLSVAYGYLYFVYRRKFLAFWFAAWGVHSLRYVFLLLILINGKSSVLYFANMSMIIVSLYFLYMGTTEFIEKKISLLWQIAFAIVLAWTAFAIFADLSFLMLTVPLFGFFACVDIWVGYSFLRSEFPSGVGKKVVGFTFILWGLHQADYPILRPIEWFAPFGYMIGTSCAMIIALGMLILFFERMRTQLFEQKEQLRQMFDEASYGIALADPETGVIIDCNVAFADMLKKGRAEVIGMHQKDFHPEEEHAGEFNTSFQQHLQGKSGKSLESKLLTSSGETIDVEIKATLIDLGQKKYLQGFFKDITEQKKAEIAIKTSGEILFKAYNSCPLLITIASLPDGRYLHVNDVLLTVTGFQREEVIGHTSSELGFWVDLNDRQKYLDDLQRLGSIKSREMQFRMRNGDVRDFLITTEIIEIDEKSCGFNFIQDITEKKIAEDKLQESEATFRKLFEDSSDAILLLDGSGVFVECNQAALDLLKMTREMFLFLPPERISPKVQPDGRLSAEAAPEMIALAYAKGLHRFDWTCVNTEGDEFIVEVSLMPVTIKGQTMLHNTWRDITERKRTQEALVASELNLKNLLTNLPVALALTDEHQTIVFRNKRFVELFGYTEEEVPTIAEWWLRAYPDIKARQWAMETWGSEVQRAIEQGSDIASREYSVTCKDGLTRFVEISGIPLGHELLSTFIDVTERKRLEEERQTLEKLNSLGTLAGGLAHDFNNILASLYGNISLAKSRMAKDSPDHSGLKYIEAAEKSMNSAILLTNQLLTFAKGGAPVKENLSLGSLIQEVVQFNLSGSNVKPVIVQADDLWQAKADQGQMQQVFANLTINAKQAMVDGGHLHISLKNEEIKANSHPALEGGRYIRITFTDQGSGIPPENLDRIFDPYFTTKQTGSGLGLATIYSIIKRHGGYISVVSKVSEGTTFTLYLPATISKDPSQGRQDVVTSISWQSGKVLIMDDDEMIRTTVTSMLEELSFTVTTADDGRMAQELYQRAFDDSEPFDLAILDVTIPGGMGGKETAQKILQINHLAKLIVSSGYADDPIMANYAEFGFCGVVSKPYNLSQLSSVLKNVLGIKFE